MFNKKSPLDGYWEEGYHYYLEIKGSRAVLRGYDKRIIFETTIKYDKNAVSAGETTDLTLGRTVLSHTANGEPMTRIKRLYFKNGSIVMDYFYTIIGDKTYTLERVDHGPFDNIVVRDKEILPSLQGLWLEWSKSGIDENEYGIRIKGDLLRFGSKDHDMFTSKIHVISYRSDQSRLYIVPDDLTVSEFPGMTPITIEKDMLTAYMVICDVSTPLSVFVRRENYDKITVPADALRPARNTMFINTDEPTE